MTPPSRRRRGMERIFFWLFALTLTGCNQRNQFNETPPKAYLDWRDRVIARTGWPMFGRVAPCMPRKQDGWVEIPTARCVQMQPPQRWRGLMYADFEISRFCPAPATVCGYGGKRPAIWMSGALRHGLGLYEVELVGRRTVYPGSFGHLSDYDYELVVDRFISTKAIPAEAKAPK